MRRSSMGRQPSTRLISITAIMLLGTALFGVCVEGVQEGIVNGSHRPIAYRRFRFSTPEEVLGTTAPSVDSPAVPDSSFLTPKTSKVLDESKIFGSRIKHNLSNTLTPQASTHSTTSISVTSSLSNIVEKKDVNIDATISSLSSSTSYPSSNNDSTSTLQWDLNATLSDDNTENSRAADEVSATETYATANTERLALADSSEVEHFANSPKDLDAQATATHPRAEAEEDTPIRGGTQSQAAGFAEPEDGRPSAEKLKAYAIPKVRDIIALNAQLLGYDTDENQGTDDLNTSRHHVRENEEDRDNTKSSSAQPSETATRNRTSRRRRRRKGQTSQYLHKETLKNDELHEGGEKVEREALSSSAEPTEREGITDEPSRQTNRYRNAMRRVKYTTRSPIGNSRRSETPTTPDYAQGEANTEKPTARARFESYRKRIPRYRVKVRRPNNHTLTNDKENRKESEINGYTTDPEYTTSTPQETTEALPILDEAAFPVTTLRTQIIHAINELQQINTLIASRKDELSDNVKSDGLSQSEVVQSKSLIQNSPGANASHYEEIIFRNPNLPQQEIITLLKTLLNRPNTPDTELLPPKNFPDENNFKDVSQDLQNFNNFTKWYGEDAFPAASSTNNNATNIPQGNTHHQSKHYIENKSQDVIHPPVYILSGIPVKALLEKDLVTSKQQKQHPRNPYDAVSHICQNGSIPEIIECLRNIDQRRSEDVKVSYNEARSPVLRNFPKDIQNNDLNLRRSSRNSTATDMPSNANRRNEGNLRNNRNSVSGSFYSQPTERAISTNGIPRYNGNISPSIPNRIKFSPTPIWGSADREVSASGIPRHNVNISPFIPNRKTVSPTPNWSSAEQPIPTSGIPRYTGNVSPSVPSIKPVSSTANLESATALESTTAKPHSSSGVHNKVNQISSSVTGAIKAGGRMLLSHLQRLRTAILDIPGHIGRLSAGLGQPTQAHHSKAFSFPPPVPEPRCFAAPCADWS